MFAIDDMIASLWRGSVTRVSETGEEPLVLTTSAHPKEVWSQATIENELGVRLPHELSDLWNSVSEVRLCEDRCYGQWGCVLWSPVNIVNKHREATEWRGRDEFRTGDLIVGEFRGDTELVVLQCNQNLPDYGSVLIALSIDGRREWPIVAKSIIEFIGRFLESPATKYWDNPSAE